MPQPLEFVIAVLACYRLSQFVPLDDGPGMAFERLRAWSLTQQARRGGASLAAFIECPYCQGVWLAGLLALFVSPRNILEWAVLTMAIAGGQAFLESWNERKPSDG